MGRATLDRLPRPRSPAAAFGGGGALTASLFLLGHIYADSLETGTDPLIYAEWSKFSVGYMLTAVALGTVGGYLAGRLVWRRVMARVSRFPSRRRGALVGLLTGYVGLATTGVVAGVVIGLLSQDPSVVDILYGAVLLPLAGLTFGVVYVGPAAFPVFTLVGYLLGGQWEHGTERHRGGTTSRP